MDSFQSCFELLQAGEIDGLLRVLEETPGAAEATDATGVSLLMQAMYRGHRALAEAIADKKRRLDIFEAATLGRFDRLKEFLGDAAALNSYSRDGFTALHLSCYFGQPEAARQLVEAGAKVDVAASNATKVMPLHSAASSRNLAAARLLVEHRAPVNARQQGGWVPIHAAAQNGDRDMIELLLAHGADPTIANDDGKTPAMIAGEKGYTEIVALLEREAAKP